MSVLFLMIPMALLLGGFFLWGFFWATSNDQMDDLETPAHRILIDDIKIQNSGRKNVNDHQQPKH